MKMTFKLDSRLSSSCIELTDWPLCKVLLKNHMDYPWLILVPRQNDIHELFELPTDMQHQLIDEISQLSTIIKNTFKLEKINIATLGNIVSQLHIHVVARSSHDPLWPHSIWQEALIQRPYSPEQLEQLIEKLLLILG